jgi:hypothetical protein
MHNLTTDVLREYSEELCHRFETLVDQVSNRITLGICLHPFRHEVTNCYPQGDQSAQLQSLSHILVKMIQTGSFPLQSTDPFGTSFFRCTLPKIHRRLRGQDSRAYSDAWSSIFLSLPSSAMRTFLTSLVSTLPVEQNPLERTDRARRSVKDQARLLRSLLGPLGPDQDELWGVVSSVLIVRNWNEHVARVLVCWASGLIDDRKVNEPGK